MRVSPSQRRARPQWSTRARLASHAAARRTQLGVAAFEVVLSCVPPCLIRFGDTPSRSCGQQLLKNPRIGGLRQMCVEAVSQCPLAIAHLAKSSQRDDVRRLAEGLGAQASARLVAVQVGHADIEQHDVWPEVGDGSQPVGPL